MIDYSLYLVTDDPSRYAGDWLDNVRAAVEGGVTCVQYRDTESAPDVRYARAVALKDALGGRAALVINNEAELAAAIRADGVHVGQNDLPPGAVRRIVGPVCEIGLSITAIAQLRFLFDVRGDVRGAGARPLVDALGVGPVFDARKTKADASDAMGLKGLSEIVAKLKGARQETRGVRPPDMRQETRGVRLPAVAIGGITLANAADVLAADADGLAVVSAFSKSSDPYETARNFTLLLDHRRQ